MSPATASSCSPGGASSSARSAWSRWRWDGKAQSRRNDDAERSRAAVRELAGLAEAPEILRDDRFHRIRRDSQPFEREAFGLRRVRHHIVRAQQRHLVRGQFEIPGGELQEQRLQLREAEFSLAPMAETWTILALTAAAALATAPAPAPCTASNVWAPPSARIPTRLTAAWESRIAASTEAG